MAIFAIARRLKRSPELGIELVGFAGDHSDPTINQQLSQRRAEVVRDFLVVLGIEPDRIHAVRAGTTDPTAAGGAPQQPTASRRVEVVWK